MGNFFHSKISGSVCTWMTRVLLIALAFMMILVFSSANASAAMQPSGYCGDQDDDVNFTFDSDSGLLTISGTGFMYYHADDEFYFSPFHNETSIKTVVINSGVKNIGRCMFSGCSEITGITIPITITNIESYAFRSCRSITDVYFTGSSEDWGKVYIGDGNEYLKNANIHYDFVPPHTHTVVVDKAIPASFQKAGKTEGSHCSGCGEVLVEQKTISKLTAALPSKAYRYDKTVKTPAVTVKSGTKVLKRNTDYTLSYTSGRKNVGTYKVTVRMKGGIYSGSKTLSFKINPKGTTLRTPTASSKAVTVKWKRQAAKMTKSVITGYQIQLATNSAFTKNKKLVAVKGYGKVSRKITGLYGGKRYYIRIRTYKTVGSVKYYSEWSAKKYIKTKK